MNYVLSFVCFCVCFMFHECLETTKKILGKLKIFDFSGVPAKVHEYMSRTHKVQMGICAKAAGLLNAGHCSRQCAQTAPQDRNKHGLDHFHASLQGLLFDTLISPPINTSSFYIVR